MQLSIDLALNAIFYLRIPESVPLNYQYCQCIAADSPIFCDDSQALVIYFLQKLSVFAFLHFPYCINIHFRIFVVPAKLRDPVLCTQSSKISNLKLRPHRTQQFRRWHRQGTKPRDPITHGLLSALSAKTSPPRRRLVLTCVLPTFLQS